MELSFEKSLAELQQIVDALEQGNADLDRSLALYERGVELIRQCNARLDEAQQRVDILRLSAEGNVVAQPFAGESAE